MRAHIAFFLLAFFLSFSLAEIEVEFPGLQPLVIPNAPQNLGFSGSVGTIGAIDSFDDNSTPIVLIVPDGGAPPAVVEISTQVDSGIVGGQRDIILTVDRADSNLAFSAGVANDAFNLATPVSSDGTCTINYDGDNVVSDIRELDNDEGFDTQNYLALGATGFQFVARSDLDTVFTVTVGDARGAFSQFVGDVRQGDFAQNYIVLFSEFEGNCDFSQVNKISIQVTFDQSIDFVLETFDVFGPTGITTAQCVAGKVLPCHTHYYEIQRFDGVQIGDYLAVDFNGRGEEGFRSTPGNFYMVGSDISGLEEELNSNKHIVDTVGGLPSSTNFDYSCVEGNCDFEIVYSSLEDTSYYFAIEGAGEGLYEYVVCLEYSRLSVQSLEDGSPNTVFFDQRPTFPPDHNALRYSYYEIDVDEDDFEAGSYLIVNISRAEPFPGVGLRLMYESLPLSPLDTGKIGYVDTNSQGVRVDDVIYPTCVNTSYAGRLFFDSPLASDPRMPCSCFTDVQLFGSGPAFQLTCQLVVDPCDFKYGRWFASVELPERDDPFNAFDASGFTNYTITASVVQPSQTVLSRNVTFKAFVEPEAVSHFRVDVPANSVEQGETSLMVHLSNVRNGFVTMYLAKGDENGFVSAGGLEACGAPVEGTSASCTTCDACNLFIRKCHFEPGTYYISVEITRDETGTPLVTDTTRLPLTYTIRASWSEDPTPTRLVAGVPIAKSIGEDIYDFYVVDVPPTIDTWLFIELYTCESDTEIVMSVLHDEIPGGDCYAVPDYYCLTGDSTGDSFNSDDPFYGTGLSGIRESCSYVIDTCQLSTGPLYITIHGHRDAYTAYGDTTYYQVPVQYTLWADFDVALSIASGVSYTENVRQQAYQHYYIRADQIEQGSSMSVEVTNIQHGGDSTPLQVYVNYNYLAGVCPCYDHLYNCTGSIGCPLTDPLSSNTDDSVTTCCTIVVPASDFRPGVWYISVLGVTEEVLQSTTPIGYTLTATVIPAPHFDVLLLGQISHGQVPQWSKSFQYANYRLAAEPIPMNDVVIKLTYLQSCDYLGSHDDATDSLWLYLNRGCPATNALGGSEYSCMVNLDSQSYCHVVIPHCEWIGDDWFVAVQGNFEAEFDGRFTIRASLDEVRDFQLTDGVSRYDRVSEGLYKHYFIESSAEEDQYLAVDLYTNSDQDRVTAYLMYGQRAGADPCFQNMAVCDGEACCNWQILACDMQPGRYYISVAGTKDQFYDISVEYTLMAAMKPVTTTLFNGDPFTAHLKQEGDIHHYKYIVADDFTPGAFLTFEVDNVKHGDVTVYSQYGNLAGRCPCFIWESTCSASSSGTEWCEVRVPACELQAGEYFFSVIADNKNTPSPPSFATPIGYTLEVNIFNPIIIDPTVALGRSTSFIEPFQFVADQRYNHYEFSTDDDDFESGHHVVVEITSVRDGALFVYYNQIIPGDSAEGCHHAQICTSGLGAGAECYWQLPYCMTETIGEGRKHYISVEGRTGRIQASYNILIYKEPVFSIIANPGFTLDGGVVPVVSETLVLDTRGTEGEQQVTLSSEIHIIHQKNHEPNGWTKFIRLENIMTSDEGRGEMLEVFFYRITNNAGEPISFNVYLHPEVPAGAHQCCSDDAISRGACQGAPCARTADTTTSANNGPDVEGHTCELGEGVGSDGNGDPLFGSRCTVRVWPCEFNKYCKDENVVWFLSVVPNSPTDQLSNGVGLQYDVQFRTRNIRLDQVGNVGSIDLTSAINSYEFTETFTVLPGTSESLGWMSFYIDYENRNNSRLSIQTEFSVGGGAVYINGDEFAAPTCLIYGCPSTGACDTLQRFYVSECCSAKYERYYITVQNVVPQIAPLQVQFRIVDTQFKAPVEIPSHPSPQAPFVATSLLSAYPGVPGVTGDSMETYILIIDDDDLDHNKQWVVSVATEGDLEVYLRFEAPGGQFGPDNAQLAYGDFDEGCHGWTFRCEAGQQPCAFQLPHCYLIEGHWYITVVNPVFDFARPTVLPQYQLTTFINDPPTVIPFGGTIVPSGPSPLMRHFVFNVTAEDLDFHNRDSSLAYTTRFVRIQLDQLANGPVVGFVNYDGLAGPLNNTDQLCASYFGQFQCIDDFPCFFDITPCAFDGDFVLKTGQYFVGVLPGTGQFGISARIVQTNYQEITTIESFTGEGNREGTDDMRWSHTVTSEELASENFRYVIDVNNDGEDDLDDDRYLTFNFTTPETTSDGVVSFTITRDDCSRYTCSVTGPNNWCTVDALELAPCSVKGGRFYIVADNPSGMTFTINLWNNQTKVETLWDSQTYIDEVYPYQYQEYEYNARSRGEASTLMVKVCSLCGDVEAFLKPNGIAGPTPDTSINPRSCSMDSCRASFGDSADLSFTEPNNCCTMFLDECEYNEDNYYVAVRGVSQEFPSASQPNLYLPARYSIQFMQTNINITKVSGGTCPQVVEYIEDPEIVPRQFVFNVESMNIGGIFRFSLIGSPGVIPLQESTLTLNINASVPYSSGCPLTGNAPTLYTCSSTTFCFFTVPFCVLDSSAAKLYLLADAPRGAQVLVERWEPFIPVIHTDVLYHQSINSLSSTEFEVPLAPNVQYYRFDLNADLHIDPNFFEKFFVRVKIMNVEQGAVTMVVNDGNIPVNPECTLPTWVDQNSCRLVTPSGDCHVDITYQVNQFLYGEDENIPSTYWITVLGQTQTCEEHSIKYDLVVETNTLITYFPVNETVCNSVAVGDYNFHRLRPHQVEDPQRSILRVTITDLDPQDTLAVYIQDGSLPTHPLITRWTENNTLTGEIDAEYICGYEDLYLSVVGLSSPSSEINYRMRVDKIPVRVKELFNDSIYYADDDDDDACPHNHDFYRFRTNVPRGNHPGAFLRVLVDSEFPFRVFVNKGDFAWNQCFTGIGLNDPELTFTTSSNVYDFCDYEDGEYFITVVSNGPYYIYTHIRDDAKQLTLGEVHRDELEPGQYQMYLLDICDEWREVDDRLVVEISDVENGDVIGWIRHGANPGAPDLFGLGTNVCSEDRAYADFGPNASGYDFLLVDSCDLENGQYRILVRAGPHPLTPFRNCEHVTFRLFPYLIDYQIEPRAIAINTPILDTVDGYTFDRLDSSSIPFTRYYKVHPRTESQGYYEQVSHAVARLSDVEGGLLGMKVMCDHLAISQHATIPGEIYGLTSFSVHDDGFSQEEFQANGGGLMNPLFKMQSGRFPHRVQEVMGDRNSQFQPECDGCSDFCCEMTYDDLDQYTKEKSCALWIPSCYFIWADFYLAVEPVEQYAIDHPISYTLEVEQTRDFVLLQPNTNQVGSFQDGNWDYDFYYSISNDVTAMRWRVRVTEGDGVLVTVRNHRCPLQATWTKQIWCDADYYDSPWMCDIEIATRAQHPGDTAYFISVHGKDAEYSIAFFRGRENCHFFKGKTATRGDYEGLDFCVSFVRYGTWRWDDYTTLDNEAECFFGALAQQFLREQECDHGIPLQCGFALKSFACFELFRRCDENGFYTGVCRDSCNAVVYECRQHFETLNLEHFNCTSSRYTDFYADTCTGGAFLAAESFFERDDPEILRFDSSPGVPLVDTSDKSNIEVLRLRRKASKFDHELGRPGRKRFFEERTRRFIDRSDSSSLSLSFGLAIFLLALLF